MKIDLVRFQATFLQGFPPYLHFSIIRVDDQETKSGLNCIGTFHCYAIKRIKKLIGSRDYTVQVKGSNICVPS